MGTMTKMTTKDGRTVSVPTSQVERFKTNQGYTDAGSSKTPTPAAKTPAPTPAKAPTPAAPANAKQATDRAYIDQTVKGGLASYITTQQARYDTADTDLKNKLKADADKLGYTLSGVATASSQQIDNRPAREKYSKPSSAAEEAELVKYETDLKNKGSAVLPGFMQADSGKYQEALMAGNRDRFYQSTVSKAPQVSKDYFGMQEAQIAKAGSITNALMGHTYSGTAKVDGLTGQEGAIDMRTGVISGNAKMLDPAYNNRMDGTPEQVYKTSYEQLVNDGQLENTPENKAWYEGLKPADAKATTGYKEGSAMNTTIASILASQQAKKPAPGAPAPDAPAPATEAAKVVDPVNQKAYLEGLVKQGGGMGEWAKLQLKDAPAAPAGAADPVNQKAYLEGLIAKGGGEAEWAKAQLNAAAATDAAAAAKPETAPAQASPDLAANFNAAIAAGNYEEAKMWAQKRQTKISGLGEAGKQYQASMDEMFAKLADASAKGGAPESEKLDTKMAEVDTKMAEVETKMETLATASEAEQGKMLEDITKYIEESGLVTLEELTSYESAREQSAAILDPKYDAERTDRMDTLSANALRRGMGGQNAALAQQFKEMGNLENQRSGEIATLAQTLVGQSKEDAYRKATFQQGQVQTKLSNMMSILQAKGQLSQTMMANLSALLTNEHNKKSENLQQKTLNQNATQFDKTLNQNSDQFDKTMTFNEKQLQGSMFGTVDGKPTMAMTAMLKEWGYKDAELAKADQLFPYQLESAKLSVASAKKSLAQIGVRKGVDPDKAEKDAGKAYDAMIKDARSAASTAADKAVDRFKLSIDKNTTPSASQITNYYNNAYDEALRGELGTGIGAPAFEVYRKGKDPGVATKEAKDSISAFLKQ